MTVEIAQSIRSKPVTIRVVATVLRALVEIGASIKSFISASHPASAGKCTASPVVEKEAVATAQNLAPVEVKDAGITPVVHNELDASVGRCTESPLVEREAVATAQIPAPVEVKGAGVSPFAHNELDEQEIERRRNVVRTFFNDFWNGAYEKPAAFVERLDRAEDYVNERLAEIGEFWQLDARMRVTLGLPPRSHSPNDGNNRAARD